MRHRSRRGNLKGKHLWNGCGSEAGKDERKPTESRVREPGRNARETRQERTGKVRKRKRRDSTEDAAVRQKREERKGRNRRPSSRKRKGSGRKKAERKKKIPKADERKQKVSTCGTAVGAKQGRTKGNKQKAKYIEPERGHGKPGRE